METRGEESRSGAAALPSMTALLDAVAADGRFSGHPRSEIKQALSAALETARRGLLGGGKALDSAGISALLDEAFAQLRRQGRAMLGPIINATGIVLHTGLGRAPLARAAVEAVVAAGGYCNLEFDMETGERGRRAGHVEAMLCRLTGAEAGLIVNNNAAATLLVLSALAAGREAVVSRGQLIEIGGSYRLPDVMACSGCVMREVGTTNKTRIGDYEAAINERTALLLHVHTSNYRVEGFAETPDTATLVALAKRVSAQCPVPGAQSSGSGLLVYDDLGSGALLDDDLWRAANEPTVPASLAAGADVVSFSGDKLLGGPQAGIILGRAEVVERLRKHPMARALRVDKLTIAALQATLALYFDPQRAAREVPALRMLTQSAEELRLRAESLCRQLAAAVAGHPFNVAEAQAFAGGGSLPAWPLATWVVAWELPRGTSAEEMARRLRHGKPAVVSRIERERIILDVRTLADSELPAVAGACRAAIAGPERAQRK